MKKLLILLVSVCLITTGLYAQGERTFRFGITASPSVAWLQSETGDYVSEGGLLGFTYGVIGDVRMGDFYSISTGINISHFGGKLGFIDRLPNVGIISLEREYRVRYLELPLTVKLHTREIGYFTYVGRLGFAPGFNLKSTATDTYVSGSTYTVEYDNKGNTPLLRAALIVGLGIEYSLGGRTSLFGGFTYNNGFTNAIKERNDVSGVRPSANANYVMLNLGILF